MARESLNKKTGWLVRLVRVKTINPWLTVGFGLTTLFFGIALVGPWLAPFDPWDMSFFPLTPPDSTHWLGINDCGQDIFSELLHAVRNTVLFGLVTGVLALAIGVLAGLASGWFGGWPDLLLMRLADILLAIPAIMVLILTAAFFQPSPLTLAVVLAALFWPPIAKSIRAQTFILRGSLHIRAAQRFGAGNWYIMRRHLLPEMFPLYLVGFTSRCGKAMFMEASLAFLGLFEPTRKSLGLMISYALKYYYMDIWWNWLMPPILCLSLMIGAAVFLAVGLERALDPRLRDSAGEGVA